MRNRHSICNWTSEGLAVKAWGQSVWLCAHNQVLAGFIGRNHPSGNLAMNLANSAAVGGWGVTGKDVLYRSFGGMLREALWVEQELVPEEAEGSHWWEGFSLNAVRKRSAAHLFALSFAKSSAVGHGGHTPSNTGRALSVAVCLCKGLTGCSLWGTICHGE